MDKKKTFVVITGILITLMAALLIIFQWSWSSVKNRPSEQQIRALKKRGLNIEKTWKAGIFRFYLTGSALAEDPSMEGAYYEGQLNSKGQFHGRGKVVFPDGERLDGVFVEGFTEGFAVSVRSDGSRKEGQYRRGRMNGHGKEIRADGICYEGEWKDDEWHGWGTATFPNGDRLTGLWNQGSFEGISKDILDPLPAKNVAVDSVPVEVPCPNCPKIITAVKRDSSKDFITPIIFYSCNRYHEIRVDLYGEKGKKEIQNYTEMIRGVRSYTIVQDGADKGKFIVQNVLYQNSGLGCGDSTIVKGRPLYRSDHEEISGKKQREVYLAGMDIPLRTRADIIIHEIPADVKTMIDAMARELFRKEIAVTSPANINFTTYRLGQLKAYDVNGDNKIDFVILEPVVKLLKPEVVEIVGELDEISLFMIVAVNGKALKRVYGAPGLYYSPRYYCIADLDGDGSLEILMEEGFGEAFHFEIYRFINGNLFKLYSGTEFGC